MMVEGSISHFGMRRDSNQVIGQDKIMPPQPQIIGGLKFSIVANFQVRLE